MKAPKKMTVMATKKVTAEKPVDERIELIKKGWFTAFEVWWFVWRIQINLFGKLMKYVEKFKNLLEEHGNKMGVESFSIDVGVPLGV